MCLPVHVMGASNYASDLHNVFVMHMWIYYILAPPITNFITTAVPVTNQALLAKAISSSYTCALPV